MQAAGALRAGLCSVCLALGAPNWALTLQVHRKAPNSVSLPTPILGESCKEGRGGTVSKSWVPGGVQRQAEVSFLLKQRRLARTALSSKACPFYPGTQDLCGTRRDSPWGSG